MEIRIINPEKGYDWSYTSCRLLKNDMIELKALLIDLQNEIRSLKSLFSAKAIEHFDFEGVLAKLNDRNNRKCNIVTFGVSESDSALDSKKCIDEERKVVSDILSAVNPDVNIADNKITRLIKITLNSENELEVSSKISTS